MYRPGIVERTVRAFLGMNYMNIPAPVAIGDTVSLEMEVIEKRELSSRDEAGLVVIDSVITNQVEAVVFEGDMKFLIKKTDWDR